MAISKLTAPTRRPKTLGAVHPNAGIEASYRAKLDKLIAEMHRSLIWWLRVQYRADPPELARDDDMPASGLQVEMDTLSRRWQDRFDEAAEEMAAHFARGASAAADNGFRAILKRAGFSVRFSMTPAVRDVTQASVAANVALIKSIPQQHLAQVQGIVMRSVQEGRDLSTLTKALQDQYGVTRRRAAIIARTQNNQATAAVLRARQEQLGITEARWLHAGAGRHPRETHIAFAAGRNGGPIYNVSEGALIDGKRIWPGTEINCRCVARPIVRGFE